MTEPRKAKGNHVVGYMRPPVSGQFKKGHSGNPKGRPKKELDIRALLQALTQQEVAVTLNGRKVKISSLEAMLHNNYNKALKADPRAFDRFLRLLERHGIAMPKEQVEAAPLDADDDAILEAFLRKQRPMDEAA